MPKQGLVSQSEILERRAKVAALRRDGVRNQRAIAQKLNLSLATVNRDCKALDEEYRAQARAAVEVEKGLDLARIEELIGAAMPDALQGRVPHIRVVNELLARRAAILGYDAPVKTQVQHDGEVTHKHVALDPDTRAVLDEAERIILERFGATGPQSAAVDEKR